MFTIFYLNNELMKKLSLILFLCIASHVAVAQEVVIAPKIDSEFNKRTGYYKRFGAQISNYYDIVSCIRTGDGKDSVALLTPYYTHVGYSGWYPDSVVNDLLVVYNIQTNAVKIYEHALLPSDSFILSQRLKPTENGFVIQIHRGRVWNPFDADIYVGDNAIDSIYIESGGLCQDANTYKFNNLYLDKFDVEMIFSLRNELCSHIQIIKDSVYMDGGWWELQELTITQPHVYRAIQEVFYDFLVDRIFIDYTERLNYKKKLILNCGGDYDCIYDNAYPFERYYINYEKNSILNLEMATDFVGSLSVVLFSFTFDLKEDKNLGEDIFVNKDKLLRIYQKKLKVVYKEAEEDFYYDDVRYIDLSQYDIKTDTTGNISNFAFIYQFHKNIYWDVSFSFEEIKPFLKPEFLRRLTDE